MTYYTKVKLLKKFLTTSALSLLAFTVMSTEIVVAQTVYTNGNATSTGPGLGVNWENNIPFNNNDTIVINNAIDSITFTYGENCIISQLSATHPLTGGIPQVSFNDDNIYTLYSANGGNEVYYGFGGLGNATLLLNGNDYSAFHNINTGGAKGNLTINGANSINLADFRRTGDNPLVTNINSEIITNTDDRKEHLLGVETDQVNINALYNFKQNDNIAQAGGHIILAKTNLTNEGQLIFEADINCNTNGIFSFGADILPVSTNNGYVEFKKFNQGIDLQVINTGVASNFGIIGKELATLKMQATPNAEFSNNIATNLLVQNSLSDGNTVTYSGKIAFPPPNGTFKFTGFPSIARLNQTDSEPLLGNLDFNGKSNILVYGPSPVNRVINPSVINGNNAAIYVQGYENSVDTYSTKNINVLGIDTNNAKYQIQITGGDYLGMNILPYDSTGNNKEANIILENGVRNVNIANLDNASQYDALHQAMTHGNNYTNDVNKVNVDLSFVGDASGIVVGSSELPIADNICGGVSGNATATIWLTRYNLLSPQVIGTGGQTLSLAIQNSMNDIGNNVYTARDIVFYGDGIIMQTADKDFYVQDIINPNKSTGSIVMGSNVSSARTLNIYGKLDDAHGNAGHLKLIDAGLANLNLYIESADGGNVNVDKIKFASKNNPNAELSLTSPAMYNSTVIHDDNCGILNINTAGRTGFTRVGVGSVVQPISSSANSFLKATFGNRVGNDLHLEDGQALYVTERITAVRPSSGTISTDGNVTISATQIGADYNELNSIVAENTLSPDKIVTTNIISTNGVYLNSSYVGDITINPVTKNDIIAFYTPIIRASSASGLGKISLSSPSVIFQVDQLGDGINPNSLGGIQINGTGDHIITSDVSNVKVIEFASQVANVYLQEFVPQNLPNITTTSINRNQNIYATVPVLNINNSVGTVNNQFGDIVAYNSDATFNLNTPNFFAGISTNISNVGVVNFTADNISPIHLGTNSLWLNSINVNSSNNNIKNVYSTSINNGNNQTNTFSGEIVGNRFYAGGNNASVNFRDANISLNLPMTADGTSKLNFSGKNKILTNIDFGSSTNRFQEINFVTNSTNNLKGNFYANTTNISGSIIPVNNISFDAINHNISNVLLDIDADIKVSFKGNTVITNDNNITTHLANTKIGQIVLSGAGSGIDAKTAKVSYNILDDNYGITVTGTYPLITMEQGATSNGLVNANAQNFVYNTPNNLFAEYNVTIVDNVPILNVRNTSVQAVSVILAKIENVNGGLKEVAQTFFQNFNNLNGVAVDYADSIAALGKNNHMDSVAESLVHTFNVVDNNDNISEINTTIRDVVSTHTVNSSPSTLITYANNGGYAAGELPNCEFSTDAYIQPIYGKSFHKKDNTTSVHNGSMGGVVLGANNQFDENLKLGIFGSFIQSNLKYKSLLQGNKDKINSYSLGVTAIQDYGDNYFLDGLFMGSFNQYKLTNKRTGFINNKVVTGDAIAKPNGADLLLRMGAGSRYKFIPCASIEGFVGVEFTYNYIQSYVERGAYSPNKTVKKSQTFTPGVYIGTLVSGSIPISQNNYLQEIKPSAKITLTHSFTKKTKQEFKLDGYKTPIVIRGAREGRTTADLQLALTTMLGNSDITIGTNYTMGKKFDAIAGWVNLTIKGLFDFMK